MEVSFSSNADDSLCEIFTDSPSFQSVQYKAGCTISELDTLFFPSLLGLLCHHLVYPYVLEAFQFGKLVGTFCATWSIPTSLTQLRSGQDYHVDAASWGRTFKRRKAHLHVTYYLCHFTSTSHLKMGQGFYKLNTP